MNDLKHISKFSFALFGGNINGKFEELVPYTKITQSWRCNQWPTGHFSNVSFEFEEKVID